MGSLKGSVKGSFKGSFKGLGCGSGYGVVLKHRASCRRRVWDWRAFGT